MHDEKQARDDRQDELRLSCCANAWPHRAKAVACKLVTIDVSYLGGRSLPGLSDLGPRICIIGPSNSGKSTLARMIGGKTELPVFHLDQLRYETGGFDTLRQENDFIADHAVLIARDEWVMDGNYSSCLASRIDRATGLILLECSMLRSLIRYVKRCRHAGTRAGGVPGLASEPVRWTMLRHIIGPTRQNRQRYRLVFDAMTKPRLALLSPRAYRVFCQSEGLSFQGVGNGLVFRPD